MAAKLTQEEKNAALSAASAKAAAAMGFGADSAEVAAARDKASKLIRDPQGLRDMDNLLQSMGLPTARIILTQLVEASTLLDTAGVAQAMGEIAAISPITEVGCMKVDFFNRLTSVAETAWLVLDRCPQDHDLGAQLGKIRPHVADNRWAEILKHLSVLVVIAREVYAREARARLPLIRKAFGLADDDQCADYTTLKVEMANTTLYVRAEWPTRVGIFVRLSAEVDAPP